MLCLSPLVPETCSKIESPHIKQTAAVPSSGNILTRCKGIERGRGFMILYFSASGNSRFIAETAAESLQDSCLCLNDRMKNQDFREIYSDTPFILVCPVFAWRIPRIFYRFIIGRSGFYTTQKCIGCGKCRQVCPLNNIEMVGEKPEWGNTCTHCMACIHQCPLQAVEFKKISVGKNRYYNRGEQHIGYFLPFGFQANRG